MGDRRQSRELALQALFFFDMDKSDPKEALAQFCEANREKLTQGVRSFFSELVDGVLENKSDIDGLINKYSKNWKVSRMPVVDRNIMRMATFELLNRPDIPDTVTINEAVEIGKKFGTKDSGPFINGVLDRIKSCEGIKQPE
ncbi:MAG: transcription antitermination factor NusB [Chlorobiales bacterium]|nr:transcription antitermination factor NusB [Chlorobiales bacterium]